MKANKEKIELHAIPYENCSDQLFTKLVLWPHQMMGKPLQTLPTLFEICADCDDSPCMTFALTPTPTIAFASSLPDADSAL